MRKAYRHLLLATLGLLILPGLAAAGEKVSSESAAAAALPPQARCAACISAHQRCFATCLGRAGEANLGDCLTGCDNAGALCSCDDAVTLLRSEDIVAARPELTENLTGTCHTATSCQIGRAHV